MQRNRMRSHWSSLSNCFTQVASSIESHVQVVTPTGQFADTALVPFHGLRSHDHPLGADLEAEESKAVPEPGRLGFLGTESQSEPGDDVLARLCGAPPISSLSSIFRNSSQSPRPSPSEQTVGISRIFGKFAIAA